MTSGDADMTDKLRDIPARRKGDVITLQDYFGAKILNPEVTETFKLNAQGLLDRVNDLLGEARVVGVYQDWIDVDTGTRISGTRGGSGDGGFRLSTSTTGAPGSQHRKARAVDIVDPVNNLDVWLTDECLSRHGLYREEPSKTPKWCHLSSHPPSSGKRTFVP
jgi:hypothetical protein